MNFNRIFAVIKKDFIDMLRSKHAMVPMIVVPLIFVAVMPAAMLLSTTNMPDSAFNAKDTEMFVQKFETSSSIFPPGFDQRQKMAYAMIIYFLAPMFLIVPVMVSSIIAANSFAGEKEQKTIEGLLYTPVTDIEILVSKILVSYIPAIAVSWLAFIVYAGVVNITGYPLFHTIIFPTLTWLLMQIFLIPVISFTALAVVVALSQRAATVWEAQQVSAFTVVPIIGLVLSQTAGVLVFDNTVVLVLTAVLLVIDAVMLYWMVKTFNREDIVSKYVS
ncbi:MAG: ABC transporter permease subunit [Elusimicrobiota bacterium]